MAVTGLFVLLFLSFISGRIFVPSVKGQSGLPAPTGLIASDGSYKDKVGLNWNAVRGAVIYRVFRSPVNDPATAQNVATTVSVVDFDFTSANDATFFYWVRAENGQVVSPFSQPDQGFSVSGTDTGICCPLGQPQVPFQNTVTAAKVFLGKTLFWDEQLSSTGTVSCGTCHQPAKGGSDGRSVIGNSRSTHPGADNVLGTADDKTGSPGVSLITAAGLYEKSNIFGLKEQVTRRKSPSVINAAFSDLLFWDGRAREIFRDPLTNQVLIDFSGALESQAVGPLLESSEMAHQGRNWNQVTTQLAASRPMALSPSIPAGLKDWIGSSTYPELFQEAFGTPEITPSRIAFAIASYERILVSDRTPWDKYIQTTLPVLTDAELRGRTVFNQSQCSSTCHLGSALTGNIFFNLGVRPGSEDGGLGEISGNPNQLAQFRTPSLRNAELRAPFMHNGRFATLEDVVEFYNRGGDFPNGNVIRPLNLSAQQKADLVALLKRPLTDPRVAAETPPFDRPTLYTESTRVPVILGTGVSGSGGSVPQAIAVEPPLVGNPSFTVALSGALGGAQATLVIDANDPGTSGIPASGSFHRSVVTLGGSGAGSGYGSVSIAIPDNAALIDQTFTGRWYVNDAGAAGGVAVSQAFRFTVFGEATFAARAKHADFDGDGKTDVSVFRPSEGNWYILNSSTGSFNAVNLGIGSDILVPEDYDGDGKTDVAIYRDGAWYLQRSRDGFGGVSFGLSGDKPQPGDYDGDGIADVAVFRPSDSTWYIQRSRDGFTAAQFGLSSDRPVAADYDGDGKTDIAIYRDGIWYVQRSRDGLMAAQFGAAEDKPVVGDYDADGKADLAVFRPSTGVWYFLRSSDGVLGGNQFGIATDLPSPGDYNGDGRNDLVVFRQSDGNWYILESSSSPFRVQHWGLSQDRSVPGALVP